MCFCVCKESNILVQRSTDPKLSLRAGQDRGARHWKMLIVQDGSAHSARALSSTPTATGRAHLAHPRHGSPAFFMLVGDRPAQRPEYSLVRGRSLRCESQGGLGDTIFRPAVPCAFRAGKGAQKDSRASRPLVQQGADFRRLTSPCVSQSSQP